MPQPHLPTLRRWIRNQPRAEGREHGGCWQGPWKLPWITFDNGRREVLVPQLLQSEVVGVGICYRIQLPVKKAWALSIHKSQGMTLDAATVQIAGCFDSGMAYVAPSRVRDIENLRFRRPCETLTCEGCERCRCERCQRKQCCGKHGGRAG